MRRRFLGKGNVAVLASGGIDSTVALYAAKEFCDSVKAIEFNYDKRPAIETERTKNILDQLNIQAINVKYPIINEEGQERSFKESNAPYYLVAGDIAKKNN
ncbi:MAG: 7-cyano-7-deazaguanine synthase [Nanobdellota archaeon]